jgi:hypothetical protein
MNNGKLLKILQPEYVTPLCTTVKCVENKCRLKPFLVFRPCTSLFDTNRFLKKKKKTSIEYIYWEGKVKILNCLKEVYKNLYDLYLQ